MYICNDDYLNYKFVVSSSDNYLVLTNQHRVYGSYDEPDDINVLVQYLNPSDLYYTTTQTFYNSRTFPQIDVTNSDLSRGDISNVIFISLLIVLLIIYIYGILSRIFVRGGIYR